MQISFGSYKRTDRFHKRAGLFCSPAYRFTGLPGREGAALLAAFLCTCFLLSCSSPSAGFTEKELQLINGADNIMRVLTITDSLDNAVLRATSEDIPASALQSEAYHRLCNLMVATVTHPSQDGVGIAGPQVGINRRIVAVQRFDKEGAPFEVYPNIRIVWASDSLQVGPEGCLSVPDRREEVMRSREIVIEYAAVPCICPEAPSHTDQSHRQEFSERQPHRQDVSEHQSCRRDAKTVRDTISGFTAVIFQHEIDHLDGILYIDRL